MVHQSRLSRVLLIPLLVALLVFEGCGLSVTNTLQLVIAAAEAAVAVVSPEYAALLNPYLRAVSQATSFAATELASTDPSSVKAEKIIAQFASLAAPNLPPGVPQTIVAAIEAVTSAVANFLATMAPSAPPRARAAAKRAAGTPSVQRASQLAQKPIQISAADEQTLAAIKGRADRLSGKLQ